MLRLIFLVAFITVLAIAITAVLATIRVMAQTGGGEDKDTMPTTFRRVAYIALIVLLLGLSSGWLGSA